MTYSRDEKTIRSFISDTYPVCVVINVVRAQEAVSTTTTSGSSSSTSATSSATTTGELSTETNAPSSAVTNAPSAATAVQGGPSGASVFSPTKVKIYVTISTGYDDNVNTWP